MRLRDTWRFTFSPEPGQDTEVALSDPVARAHIARVSLEPPKPPSAAETATPCTNGALNGSATGAFSLWEMRPISIAPRAAWE